MPFAGAAAAHDQGARAQARNVWNLPRLVSTGPRQRRNGLRLTFHRRFDNRRQVAAYVGLAGSPFNSGRTTRDQGISKAGNPKARTTMIELAWLWRRHQPQSALSCWFQQRVGTLQGRVRRIAIVALARKLLVALWRYLETGLVPADAVLKG